MVWGTKENMKKIEKTPERTLRQAECKERPQEGMTTRHKKKKDGLDIVQCDNAHPLDAQLYVCCTHSHRRTLGRKRGKLTCAR